MPKVPSWLLDMGIAALFALSALAVERATEGRLWTVPLLGWVGIGSWLLLRIGATLAQAGRTLGCGFAFALSWVLPCVALSGLIVNPEWQRIVRDSPAFFFFAGFVLIAIMAATFERVRRADEQRATRDDRPPSGKQHVPKEKAEP